MTSKEIISWIEKEADMYPSRATGNEANDWLARRIVWLIESHRAELVSAFSSWIKLRDEFRTMFAVDMAEKYHLTELSEDIKDLLNDVKNRKAFLPYYAEPITDVLNELEKLQESTSSK